MLLDTKVFPYINTITHEGKILLFGTDAEGKVWYTVKQDGFEDAYLSAPPEKRTGWEDWKPLEFPNEAAEDASVTAKEAQENTYFDNGVTKYIVIVHPMAKKARFACLFSGGAKPCRVMSISCSAALRIGTRQVEYGGRSQRFLENIGNLAFLQRWLAVLP